MCMAAVDFFGGVFVTVHRMGQEHVHRIGKGRAVLPASEGGAAVIASVMLRIRTQASGQMSEAFKGVVKTLVALETAFARSGQPDYCKQILGLVSSRFSCFAIATAALRVGARLTACRKGTLDLSLLFLRVLRPFFLNKVLLDT